MSLDLITIADDRPSDGWIQTFTGRQFWPLEPRAEDVCIEDIAHALAMKCRYTGHTREFYSVAQHSVLLSRYVPACYAPWGLLHDATEAYLPDVAKPVKPRLIGFDEIELRLMIEICEAFGLRFWLPTISTPDFSCHDLMPRSVNEADGRMLWTERRDLLRDDMPWGHIERFEPYPEKIVAWSPELSETRFWERWRELTEVAP